MSPGSEDRLLAWLRRRLAAEPGTPLLGDDGAVLPSRAFAVTVDSQIAGVHFPPDLPEPALARRLLAVNLSDLAAMGADPAYGFLALSAVQGFDHRRFFTAFLAACRRHGVRLAGGDLARQPQTTTATLTLLGTRPPGGRFLRRSDARPGDHLWLSGTVGESAAGRFLLAAAAQLPTPTVRRAARRAMRRHLEPTPHLSMGRFLGRQRRAAAIDLSDGLSLDLSRLCRESGVGARIDPAALPLPPHFADLCRVIDRDPLQLALSGGEDYVLLFALPAGHHPPAELGCTRIGEVKGGRRLEQIVDGQVRALPVEGWDHLANRATSRD
ncbi:MAG TPA: thiamine-phosphate kinase [Thermoanaerobaculia bacterium]|nr:thiamine-phosphate kinase [Thermoanaerobaculia bacterium]